jgi:superfamily II DNA or RNA helicase
MHTDSTFFTNEKDYTLLKRFQVTLENNTQFFDVLVGYFRTSGFFHLYQALEKVEKIRILVGINLNKQAHDLIAEAKDQQLTLTFSHKETKDAFCEEVAKEMEESEDNSKTEIGVQKFVEFIRSGKLEIKAYPSQSIHAKVYIIRKDATKSEDYGRVITGSSNFSYTGLHENLEFNVELKDSRDVKYALEKFEALWKDSVDISEKYIETINSRTWLNNTIAPYELYLKFLYEYFKDELNQSDEIFYRYVPTEFKKLEYQEQAVLNAKKILEEYGGVFISDVVGLGKTYISAMLAGQLDGRTLVIAPPVLLEKNNPGSWPNVFDDFRVQAHFESIGKLDSLVEAGTEKFTNVIIDEAHRFRTESNMTYEKLAEICRGKRVILVTATPYNNSPKDILSQIKLFQKARKSTIPNLQDLEKFFSSLEKKLKALDRQRDYSEYIKVVKENAREIREKVLKYLMVRRTRSEIIKYFSDDFTHQKLRFPDVEKPEPFFYELNDEEDAVFTRTIELIAQKFKYARYTPLLYYKGDLSQPELLSQRNMGKFMKILMVKRLESSFFAFRNTLDRFIHSYEQFIAEFDRGNVYVSKKHSNKIFEFLEDDDDAAIQQLIDEGKADKFKKGDFKDDLRKDLQSDLDILKEIHTLWTKVKRDPKLLTFLEKLSTKTMLKNNKLIIFTESKETAEYLARNIENKFPSTTLCFTGSSGEAVREKVIDNFDAKVRHPKDGYRILVSTEVLSEGVNLHRANVVINYDIPWNPTRMMQRVGRINRVDTKFDVIYTFNFFPTKQANDQIKLKEAAEAKINAFISMLGSDVRLLTEGEPIEQHELFNRLTSKKAITGEDEGEESELKYLQVIRIIRDKDPETFERIKRLPKKARTARATADKNKAVLTYFRRGKLQKFFKTALNQKAEELDFITAAKTLECDSSVRRGKVESEVFYELIDQNKQAFIFATTEEIPDVKLRGGRDSATQVLRIIKATMKDSRQFTEDQEEYLKKTLAQLEEGGLPKQTTKKTLQALNEELKKGVNPLRILAVLQANIPAKLLEGHFAESSAHVSGKREVILSEYLMGG